MRYLLIVFLAGCATDQSSTAFEQARIACAPYKVQSVGTRKPPHDHMRVYARCSNGEIKTFTLE